MSRFTSRLTRLLRARRIAEEQARAELAQARAQALSRSEHADRCREQLERGRRELAERISSKDRLLPGEVLASQHVIDGIDDARGRAVEESAKAEAAAEELREVWSGARRDVRAIEQLEDRRRRAHADEEKRKENAELDEWASTARHRNAPGKKLR